MAKLVIRSFETLKSLVFLLLLAAPFATLARILEEVTPQIPLPAVAPLNTNIPNAEPPSAVAPDTFELIEPPQADNPDAAPPVAATTAAIPTTNVAPIPTTPTSGTAATPSDHPTLSFFMHDILGGSQPSGRVVTGIIASSNANNLPFSKPSNQIFPLNGGVPLNTINGVINDNNYPFLAGLNGSPTNTLIQNNGNNC